MATIPTAEEGREMLRVPETTKPAEYRAGFLRMKRGLPRPIDAGWVGDAQRIGWDAAKKEEERK